MARAGAAADTSVAVPLLVASHESHAAVVAAVGRRRLALPAHALAETYSVLTRLPGDARVEPADAIRLIDANFPRIVVPRARSVRRIHEICAALSVAGGAVYDALVAVAARDHGIELLTRDRRAELTYELMKIPYSVIA